MSEFLEQLEGYSFEELLAGISDPSLGEQEMELVIALVSNAVGDRVEELTEEQVMSASRAALSQAHVFTHLCLALICNMTVVERHAAVFLGQAVGERADPALARKFSDMLDQFLHYNPQAEKPPPDGEAEGGVQEDDSYWSEADPYGHVASILCNLAVLEEGRAVLLKQSNQYLPKLVLQFRSRNLARRQGSVGALRTCLFDKEVHWWMLHEVKVLTPLMLPLVAPTPFTEEEKKGMDPQLWMLAEDPTRRPDANTAVLKMLLECLLLLCQRRAGREELRKRKVYPVIRNLDLFMEDDDINNVVVDLVDFLIRDEEPGQQEDEET